MRKRKRPSLMAEIGRLLVEYPEKDWQALAGRLRDRVLIEDIARAIDHARGAVTKSTEKTKVISPRPRASVLAQVARDDRAKAEVLFAFKSRLTDQGHGVTLAYIRGLASSLGMKEELASRKEQAVNQVVRYLASKTTDEIEAALRTALPVQQAPGQEFDRWVDLILGAGSSKGRQTRTGKPLGVDAVAVDASVAGARTEGESRRKESRFGIPRDTWIAARNEAREAMIRVASREGTISYSDLVERIESCVFSPDDHRLHEMLGEISTDEDTLGRGLLTVVVVHKDGDMQPGPGFFDLAKRRGRDTTDRVRFWSDELKKVHSVWS